MKPSRTTFQRLAVCLATFWGLGAMGCPGDNGYLHGCLIGGSECPHGCDPNVGCVQCVGDGDCGAAKPFCVLGTCEECAIDRDCSASQACYPRRHECEPLCTQNGNCHPEEPMCDLETGRCVGCLIEADCGGSHPFCDPVYGQCVDCFEDFDCAASAPVCDQAAGECRQCIVDGHCDHAEVCEGDHKCHPACVYDSDCTKPSEPFCDFERRKCVECLMHVDCGAAEPICKKDGKCVVCEGNADCEAALPICKDDFCVQCDKNEDCLDYLLPKCTDHYCVAN